MYFQRSRDSGRGRATLQSPSLDALARRDPRRRLRLPLHPTQGRRAEPDRKVAQTAQTPCAIVNGGCVRGPTALRAFPERADSQTAGSRRAATFLSPSGRSFLRPFGHPCDSILAKSFSMARGPFQERVRLRCCARRRASLVRRARRARGNRGACRRDLLAACRCGSGAGFRRTGRSCRRCGRPADRPRAG